MMARLSADPLVKYVYARCRRSGAGKVLVATSTEGSDDVLYNYCKAERIPAMRGDIDNVVKRYADAARAAGIEYICRVCGDTPFVDTALIDALFDTLISGKLDYAAPDRQTCAPGFYCETFTLKALTKVLESAKSPDDLEHVTKYILDNRDKFAVKLVDAGLNPDFARKTRFTIDYPEDIETGRKIAARLSADYSFTSRDVLEAVREIG